MDCEVRNTLQSIIPNTDEFFVDIKLNGLKVANHSLALHWLIVTGRFQSVKVLYVVDTFKCI